jgi:hypothetical protein
MCVGCAIDCERADRKARPLPGQQRPATARMIPAWCGRHAVEKTARPAPAGGGPEPQNRVRGGAVAWSGPVCATGGQT